MPHYQIEALFKQSEKFFNELATILVDDGASPMERNRAARMVRALAGGPCPICRDDPSWKDEDEIPCPLCCPEKTLTQETANAIVRPGNMAVTRNLSPPKD